MQQFHREWIEAALKFKRLVIFAPVETGKSEIFSIAYPIWRLGREANLRIGIVSNTATQASRFLEAIKSHITSNDRIKLVFPELEPQRDALQKERAEKWTDTAIMVKRERIMKDYSIIVSGVGGPLLNARLDLLIFDDVVDEENSATEVGRGKVIRWTESTALSRLTKEGQFICIGTAWHYEDLYHYLAKNPSFKVLRYSMEEEDEKLGYRVVRWEKRFPKRRLEEIKNSVSETEYMRQRRCICLDPSSTLIGALERAKRERLETGEDWKRVIGVDLSTKKRKGTAFVTLAYEPKTDVKIVEDVQFRQFTSPQTGKYLEKLYEEKRPLAIVVESNAYQVSLGEWLKEVSGSRLPLRGFFTGKNKGDPESGIASIATEIESERLLFKDLKHRYDCNCDYCRLLKEIKFYPNYQTQDGLMALWFALDFVRKKLKRKKSIFRL